MFQSLVKKIAIFSNRKRYFLPIFQLNFCHGYLDQGTGDLSTGYQSSGDQKPTIKKPRDQSTGDQKSGDQSTPDLKNKHQFFK